MIFLPQTQQRLNCPEWRLGSYGQTQSGAVSSCLLGFSRYFHHLASAHTEEEKGHARANHSEMQRGVSFDSVRLTRLLT